MDCQNDLRHKLCEMKDRINAQLKQDLLSAFTTPHLILSDNWLTANLYFEGTVCVGKSEDPTPVEVLHAVIRVQDNMIERMQNAKRKLETMREDYQKTLG